MGFGGGGPIGKGVVVRGNGGKGIGVGSGELRWEGGWW